MRKIDLKQETDEWVLWRATGITSSNAAVIMDCSPWNTAVELWKEKAGLIPARRCRETFSMRRGKQLLPEARGLYQKLMGFEVPPCCGVHETLPWIKSSLDGWNDQYRVVVEIKAVNAENHFMAMGGQVPEYYYWQCQHHILVSGPRICHYVSYSPQQAQKRLRLAIVPVYPGRDTEDLLAAETKFWRCVQTRTPLAAKSAV